MTCVDNSANTVFPGGSGTVATYYWVIPAIDEQIVCGHARTSAHHTISVDESANFGIVISALEVVQPGLRSVA